MHRSACGHAWNCLSLAYAEYLCHAPPSPSPLGSQTQGTCLTKGPGPTAPGPTQETTREPSFYSVAQPLGCQCQERERLVFKSLLSPRGSQSDFTTSQVNPLNHQVRGYSRVGCSKWLLLGLLHFAENDLTFLGPER